jgi:hypothetical protein
VFVALAGTGATPVKRSVGKEMKLPPPATALSALATAPTTQSKMAWWMVKGIRLPEFGRCGR